MPSKTETFLIQERSLHFFLSASRREKKVPFVAPMPMTAWFAMLMPGAK